MKIGASKVSELVALMFLAAALLIVPLAYGGGPISDDDYDVGPISGSWTEAEICGWFDPPIVYNIYHDDDFDTTPGYWCIPDYDQWPLTEGEDDTYGYTWRQIEVRQDTTHIEWVESISSIPYI